MEHMQICNQEEGSNMGKAYSELVVTGLRMRLRHMRRDSGSGGSFNFTVHRQEEHELKLTGDLIKICQYMNKHTNLNIPTDKANEILQAVTDFSSRQTQKTMVKKQQPEWTHGRIDASLLRNL